MRFYLINIFHRAASVFCTEILERGFMVHAVGLHGMERFTEEEETQWMDFGRNANLLYQSFEAFLSEAETDAPMKVLYFPFVQQELHRQCTEKLAEWRCPIYLVSEEEQLKEQEEKYILISENAKQFLRLFSEE